MVGFLIALLLWGWFDVRNRGRINPADHWAHKTDFTVYTEAGAAFFDGRPPYEVTNSRGWSYLYPPLFALLVAPLHSLAPENQVYVWFLVSLVACWGCFVELRRLGNLVLPDVARPGTFGRIPTWLGCVACATATIPTLNCLQRGQVGVAKLYLLLAGFRLIVQHRARLLRPLWGGCLLALAITLKITPLVPACLVVAQQGVAAWRAGSRAAWVRAAAASGGLALGMALWLAFVPALVIGWNANRHHLHTWWMAVAARAESISEDDFAGNSTSVRNQSLANAAYRFGNWAHYYFAGGPHDEGPQHLRNGGPGLLMDAPWIESATLGVRLLAGLLLLAVCFRAAYAGPLLDQAVGFGMACAATLVLFTIARGHYYMLLLPAGVFAPLWFLQNGQRRWACTVAIGPLVLVLAHYLALNVAGRIGLLGLGTTLWYFSTCGAFVLVRRRPLEATAAKPRASGSPPEPLPLAA